MFNTTVLVVCCVLLSIYPEVSNMKLLLQWRYFDIHWGAFATYLLAAQKSMFLLHGCQQCILTHVLHLAIISCFTNYRGTMSVWNSRSGRKHHSLVSPGTSLTSTCIKSECPAQAQIGGCGTFKWLAHKRNTSEISVNQALCAVGMRNAILGNDLKWG